MHRALFLAPLVLLSVNALVSKVDASADRAPILAHWYQSVGGPLPGEDFGTFLSRVAQVRIDTPYAIDSEGGGPEAPALALDHFECVSLLESSLAVARCAWQGRPTDACFVWESVGLRYRGGIMGDYSSRLHYFVDWLEDNEGRGRLRNLTPELRGQPLQREFHYLTGRASLIPALTEPVPWRSMRAVEKRLSSRGYSVVEGKDIRRVLSDLRDGDLVAIAGNKPGRLVIHAGLAVVEPRPGKVRLLHASSYHRRVVLSREDLADYVTRRPERRGILVARPLPPLQPQ